MPRLNVSYYSAQRPAIAPYRILIESNGADKGHASPCANIRGLGIIVSVSRREMCYLLASSENKNAGRCLGDAICMLLPGDMRFVPMRPEVSYSISSCKIRTVPCKINNVTVYTELLRIGGEIFFGDADSVAVSSCLLADYYFEKHNIEHGDKTKQESIKALAFSIAKVGQPCDPTAWYYALMKHDGVGLPYQNMIKRRFLETNAFLKQETT